MEETATTVMHPARLDVDACARVWEAWPGNNRFFCQGRVLAGPGLSAAFGTTLMVLLPVVIFSFNVGTPKGPRAQDSAAWMIPVCFAIMVVSLSTLWATYATDPGIIPRGDKPDCDLDDMPVRNEQNWRFCRTCYIWKPPRSHHCRDCNNCVLVFDHHCPWVGNCVARRNYKFFVGFVSTTWALDAFVILGTIRTIALSTDTVGDIAEAAPLLFVLVLYCICTLCMLWSLCGYHLYLISSGATTKEQRKGMMPYRLKPADERAGGSASQGADHELVAPQLTLAAVQDMNCAQHWWQVCGVRRPASRVTPRALLDDMLGNPLPITNKLIEQHELSGLGDDPGHVSLSLSEHVPEPDQEPTHQYGVAGEVASTE